MSIQELGRRIPYPLRLAREASGISAFKDFFSSEEGDECITLPVGFAMGAVEFILPATMRFIRENIIYDEMRPMRNALLCIASVATDVATNGLIYMAGFDRAVNIPARRIALNYATHMGVDFIQHLHYLQSRVRPNYERSEITSRPASSKQIKIPRKTTVKQTTLVIEEADFLNISTGDKGRIRRDKSGNPIKDSHGRLVVDFPGPPKYTAGLTDRLIGTKYQKIKKEV